MHDMINIMTLFLPPKKKNVEFSKFWKGFGKTLYQVLQLCSYLIEKAFDPFYSCGGILKHNKELKNKDLKLEEEIASKE